MLMIGACWKLRWCDRFGAHPMTHPRMSPLQVGPGVERAAVSLDHFRTFYPDPAQPNILFLFDAGRMDFGV